MALKLLNFLPQEEKFYRMMEELSVYANRSVLQLEILLKTDDPAQMDHAAVEISDIKTQAKACNRNLTHEVCRTFITPFDREDIQGFAVTLYNIPKLINKIQNRLMLHRIRPFNNDFIRMVDIMVQQTTALSEVIQLLNNGRKVKDMHEKSARLHDLEDQGDQLLGQLIAESFFSIQDTREVILRKDIYEMLEDVTDFYRDCANLALRIVLKHS